MRRYAFFMGSTTLVLLFATAFLSVMTRGDDLALQPNSALTQDDVAQTDSGGVADRYTSSETLKELASESEEPELPSADKTQRPASTPVSPVAPSDSTGDGPTSTEKKSDFIVTTVVRAPYGEGAGEVGHTFAGGTYRATQSFDVSPDGNIFLLDSSRHNRVLAFDDTGAFLFSFPLHTAHAYDIKYVPGNVIIILDNPQHRIYEYDHDGSLKQHYRLPTALGVGYGYLASTPDQNLLFRAAMDSDLNAIPPTFYAIGPLGEEYRSDSFIGYPLSREEGTYVTIGATPKGTKALNVWSRDGNILASYPLSFPSDIRPTTNQLVYGPYLIGTDGRSCVYGEIAVFRRPGELVSKYVVTYAENGNVVGTTAIKKPDPNNRVMTDDYIAAYVNWRVMEDGTLYHMHPASDGVYIMKYENGGQMQCVR